MTAGAIPPYSEQAERAVVGACLIDGARFAESANVVLPNDFYSGALQACYQAFADLDAAGIPIDMVTTATRLQENGKIAQVGGVPVLTELMNATPNIQNVTSHARVVRAKAIARRTLVVLQRAQAELYSGIDGDEDVTARVARECSDLLDRRGEGNQASAAECFGEFMRTIDAAWDGSGFGCETGYVAIDRHIGSLRPQELSLLMGRPGLGKTSLAAEIAMNVAKSPGRGGSPPAALFFSLEMPRAQIVGRLACAAMGVNMTAVRIRHAVDDRVRLEKARSLIEQAHLFLDERPALTLSEVRNTVRAFQRKLLARGLALELVVIDYLQLMRGEGTAQNREGEIASISRGLKAMAKEFRVHVLALAQMNRDAERRGDKRPTIPDLRESGALEQDADNIFALYREDYYDNGRRPKSPVSVTEVIVLKQRAGATGTALVGFERDYTRFRDLTQREADSYHPDC